MPAILIVDGDAAMRETLREQLTRDGAFVVVEAAGAREAEACLAAEGSRFAAVIMDATLPDGDGHAVRASLRASGLSMPVILLNGLNRTSVTDDTTIIAKPFRLSELMAHLRARLEARTVEAAAVRFTIGPYEFNSDEKALRHEAADRRIRLTEKETAILAFLYRMGERAVPRLELLREVWGYNPAVTTHTLETHIYRLRRKIEVDPAKACILVTEAGGYRLAKG
ncbi:MAG: response regulator transcription factor [Acetobacteraceae bacterium]|nr:response regulator transcription factor [Acetobacteraceae bacterium]